MNPEKQSPAQESLESYEARSIEIIDDYLKNLEGRVIKPQTALWINSDREPNVKIVDEEIFPEIHALESTLTKYTRTVDGMYTQVDPKKFQELSGYVTQSPELIKESLQNPASRDYVVDWLYQYSNWFSMVKEERDLVAHIQENNIHTLEEMLADPETFHLHPRIFAIITKMLLGNETQNRLANAFLKNNISYIEQLLVNHGEILGDTIQSKDFIWVNGMGWLEEVERNADPDIVEALQIMRKKLATLFSEKFRKNPLYDGESEDSLRMRREFEALIAQYGFDPKEMMGQWFVSCHWNPEKIDKLWRKNLRSLMDLEKWKQGSAVLLNKEYGIADFGRYPMDTLKEQYLIHNKDVPYGLIIYSEDDHSGALYEHVDQLAALDKNLLGFNIHSRIVEVGGKRDLARFLIKFDRTYGRTQKLEYALMAGHGGEDWDESHNESSGRGSAIKLGSGRKEFTNNDIIRLKSESMAKFFKPQATIVLFSCSTGADTGIASLFSEKSGLKVIAPPDDTGINHISATQDGETIDFDVEYSKSSTATYLGGKRQ